MELGITAELKAQIVALFEAWSRFQSEAGLGIGDGATIHGDREVSLTARLVEGRLTVVVNGPKPRIVARRSILSFQGELQGVQIDRNKAVIVIDGLPDVTVKLT